MRVVIAAFVAVMLVSAAGAESLYRTEANGSITRLSDKASIPPDAGNADYQDFVRWQAAGNIPDADVTKLPNNSIKVLADKLRK